MESLTEEADCLLETFSSKGWGIVRVGTTTGPIKFGWANAQHFKAEGKTLEWNM